MNFPRQVVQLLLCAGFVVPACSHAQVDPEKRQLFHLGYNQSLQGLGPVAAYAFYYLNIPDWPREGQTLRLAVAPVYLDSELAFREALGPQTHLAFGAAGGGFADGQSEVRGGKFIKEESYNGHGGEVSASVYHRFNPEAQIPLNAVLRLAGHSAVEPNGGGLHAAGGHGHAAHARGPALRRARAVADAQRGAGAFRVV